MSEDCSVYPTRADVEKFDDLYPMIASALKEMREFAKKKQDGIVSVTKIKILNRLLVDIREVLRAEKSINYLDMVDDEAFPQNSDVVIIFGQYMAALDRFRSDYYGRGRGGEDGYGWMTQEFCEELDAEGNGEDDDDEDEDS